MARRWFVSPIVAHPKGGGWCSKMRQFAGVDHITDIPRNPDGTLKFNWCICFARSADFTAVDADVDFDPFPGVQLSEEMGSFTAAERDRIQNALTNRGVDLTGITLTSTVRDLLRRGGRHIGGGNWDNARFGMLP